MLKELRQSLRQSYNSPSQTKTQCASFERMSGSNNMFACSQRGTNRDTSVSSQRGQNSRYKLPEGKNSRQHHRYSSQHADTVISKRTANKTQVENTMVSINSNNSRNSSTGNNARSKRSTIFEGFNYRQSQPLNDIRSKLYLRLLIRLTEEFGSKQHGSLIKETFDHYLQTNPVIDNDTFLKVESVIHKKLDKSRRQCSLSPLNKSVELSNAQRTQPTSVGDNSINDYEQRMKAEYRRQFVDVNFYGMQTKVANPMSSPEWRKAEIFSFKKQDESLERLKQERALMKEERKKEMKFSDAMLERSPSERMRQKQSLLNGFKDNVSGLITSQHVQDGKYKNILLQSFGNETKRVVDDDSPFCDEMKKYSKQIPITRNDGKLWMVIDKLKVIKAEQQDHKEKQHLRQKKENYINQLQVQSQENQFKRQMEREAIQNEKNECHRDLEKYYSEVKQQNQEKTVKRNNYNKLQLDDIRNEKEKGRLRNLFDVEQSLLMNTKDIEQMEHFQRIRDQETRLRKQKDDKINNKKAFEQKIKKVSDQVELKATAGNVPFYERLRNKDHKLENRLQDESNQKRKIQQHKAAFVGDTCIINSVNFDEFGRIDQDKADREALERYEKAYKAKEQISQVKKNQVRLTQNNNFEAIVEKEHKQSPLRILQQNRKDHRQTMKDSNTYATVKLPEICTGMDEKDFRTARKKNYQEYKKVLDGCVDFKNSNQNVIFQGMSETEIQLNQAEFKELGLL